MLILDILQDHSDAGHPLTQQDILKLLRSKYDIECDRRSVKNNIEYLIDLGIEINDENGYYLIDRPFDDAELQLLIKSVVFSKAIPRSQAKDLINKLTTFGSVNFSPRYTRASSYKDLQHTDNKQVLLNLDILDEAIEKKKKVSFIYNAYGTDMKMHPKREEPFVFNPYQVVISNARYYLMGNYDKYDTLSHFRIDRMTEMKLLDETAKSPSKVRGMEHGLDLPKHMAEHIYMFSGAVVTVEIRTEIRYMDDLIDWFGRDFSIIEKRLDGTMDIRVRCNAQAMEYWALQYGRRVEVLAPETLREQIRKDILEMAKKYEA